MQAGESLSFITTPEELAIAESQSDEELEAVWSGFGTLIQGLMIRHTDSFRSIEQQDEDGPVSVTEGSFWLPFADTSYLHVVAYGHTDDAGILDLGLSVVEHSPDGRNLGGYLFEMNGEAVRYSQHPGQPTDQTNDETSDGTIDDEPVTPEHFSLLGYYERANEAYTYLFSEDEQQRTLAEEALRQLEEEATLGLTERELGFGWSTPSIEDIEKLRALAEMVSPFTVPTH